MSPSAVHYVDPSTGRTYPLGDARWRADNGHYVNLSPGPGLRRGEIDGARRSVWRYAAALPAAILNPLLLAPTFVLCRRLLRALSGWTQLRLPPKKV